jgi:hypothetical protein
MQIESKIFLEKDEQFWHYGAESQNKNYKISYNPTQSYFTETY